MATDQENQDNFEKTVARVQKLGTPAEIADQIFNKAEFERRGGIGGKTTFAGELAWNAANFARIEASNQAQTANLIAALKAVAGGETFDEQKLLAGVQAAAETGLRAALESITETKTTTATFKEGGTPA